MASDEGSAEGQSPDGVRMHRCLLYLQPRYVEQEYFRQLEAFDLVNCLIAPIFFANALSLWTRGVLASIYCAVLLIKGYQMGLLLLPNARRVHAHKHARYWLILGERVLRQCFATPLLGRGPRFQAWLVQQAAQVPQAMFCTRLLLLVSGLTISFWNAFCLQLDFVSNLLVTFVFFCIHFQANCTQIAYAFQLLVERVPHVLLLQQGVENTLATAARLLQTVVLLQPSAGSPIIVGTAAAAAVHGSCDSGAQGLVLAPDTAADLGMRSNIPAAAPLAAGDVSFERPDRAPDFDSVAGRFIITCSTTYMVFAVLLLPLYMSWRIERSWKSRWMANLPEVQQRQQLLQRNVNGEPVPYGPCSQASAVGSNSISVTARPVGCLSRSKGDSSSPYSSDAGGGSPPQQQPQRMLCTVLFPWQRLRSLRSKRSRFVHPPVVYDIAPPLKVLSRHLGLMLGSAIGIAGTITAVCTWHRGLSGVLFTWSQLV